MRVLLSTIGSRGDVQPLVALASALRALGRQVRLCVPPDFRGWIEGLGFDVTPIGPELRTATPLASPAARPSPDELRQIADASVATQFETIAAAAEGCGVIVAATALQVAAASIAEKMRIPYVFAAYCPTVLPSPRHAPPPLSLRGETPPPPNADNHERWARNAARFNATFRDALNAHRKAAGLSTIDDVRSYMFTDRPWLAADPTLGPWPDPEDKSVFQTGAWILRDDRPLPREVEAFLDAGEPSIYFGFGSVRPPQNLAPVMIRIGAARAIGRRAIVSRGWADLHALDHEPDCLAIGDTNLHALFKRVAAVVHHGGAGTTAAAALGGAPQVVIPGAYDQHYWARRVQQLGIGTAHEPAEPTIDSLTAALDGALHADVTARAKSLARLVLRDGAQIAAQQIVRLQPGA